MVKIPKELVPTEKGFLFDPYTGYTYTLNVTGRFIFSKLQQGMSIQDIAKIIADEYKIDERKVHEDIKNFVEDIKSFGIDKK